MTLPTTRTFRTPRREELQLFELRSKTGLSASVLANGTVFSIDYADAKGAIMVNQVLGSPAYGGIGRLYLRIGGNRPEIAEIVGPKAKVAFAANESEFLWRGETQGIRHTVRLSFDAAETYWTWQVKLENGGAEQRSADLVLVQDIGIGDRGFLMGSEAYASQYIDHHIAEHSAFGPVIMNRQNLKQGGGRNPWLVHGCLTGAAAYATDAIQLQRGSEGPLVPPFGTDLPSTRRQHEVACPAIQSKPFALSPGAGVKTGFFALLAIDHPEASADSDLSRLDVIAQPSDGIGPLPTEAPAVRSLVQDAALALATPLSTDAIGARYPTRFLEESRDGTLLSFFVPDGEHNRHIVLAEKEALVARRHGAIVRSGQNMLLDDKTLAATCWMQGIFAAQLTIGNTSFHKLFSVSRDPYNLTRASGLRMLVDLGEGWQLLDVPSAFEMGLSDCRWIYAFGDRTITVSAIASGAAAAMQWSVSVEGAACRFLAFGHLVLGERDYEASSTIAIDAERKRAAFSPDPNWLWGQRYPQAAYWLTTSTPDAVETIGGDELLFADGIARQTPYVTLLSRQTNALAFAVSGSMTSASEAEGLADRYAAGVADEAMLEPARKFWNHVTRNLSIEGTGRHLTAQAAMLPWLAHDAIVHLSVPHGLEQYTGAAWGTRDVCQGPIEFMLAYEHDAEVRDILTTLFSEQYRDRGDWPQWFMLEPYANIRAGESHGDIVVWPLKALCDYLEATDDLAFLKAPVSWRADDTMEWTTATASIADHVEKLLATVRSRFIPGTALIRYGEGDWNDSLQPADPHLRDWMVSSWTVSLLYEQIVRYGLLLQRVGNEAEAASLAALAESMKQDFNRHLIRDGVVAGYGLFDPAHDGVELLLHPQDKRTGLHYSLISMTQPMIGNLFSPEQRQAHMALIEEHLLFPDGVRLMEKPARYTGGPETLFRRAESSAFFGREIGLMYTHAHLRYCEALAIDGDSDAMWDGLALVNPIAVTDSLPHATLRQRNTYFSSSDAAFADRYEASRDWDRVKAGTIDVDGGWRIYSSGPGLFTKGLIGNVLGFKRQAGKRVRLPLQPEELVVSKLQWDLD